MANTQEKLKDQLEKIKFHTGVKMESTDYTVSVERAESNEAADYSFDNAADFAEGIMFILDLIENGYIKVRT